MSVRLDKQKVLIAGLLLLAAVQQAMSAQETTVNAADQPQYRTWTARTGTHQTEAIFVEVEDGKVMLKKRDGTTIKVPLESLSNADQEYVQQSHGGSSIGNDGPGVRSSRPPQPAFPAGEPTLKGKYVFQEMKYINGPREYDCLVVVQDLVTAEKRVIYSSRINEERPTVEREKPIADYKAAPSWTRDGKKVVFIGKMTCRSAGPDFALAVPARKANLKPSDVEEWRPIGGKSNVYEIGQGSDLWIMDENGEGLRAITRFENCEEYRVSPDGARVAYRRRKSYHHSDRRISGTDFMPPFCVVETDTGRMKTLPTPKAVQRSVQQNPGDLQYRGPREFCWAPDSKRIAFVVGALGGSTAENSIWVVNYDGSNMRQLTATGTTHGRRGDQTGDLVWWPDNKISFRQAGTFRVIAPDEAESERSLGRAVYEPEGFVAKEASSFCPLLGRVPDWYSSDGATCAFFGTAGKEFVWYVKRLGDPRAYVRPRPAHGYISLHIEEGP